jgi:hypothetical protein
MVILTRFPELPALPVVPSGPTGPYSKKYNECQGHTLQILMLIKNSFNFSMNVSIFLEKHFVK